MIRAILFLIALAGVVALIWIGPLPQECNVHDWATADRDGIVCKPGVIGDY
jgi:hypothetical protein